MSQIVASMSHIDQILGSHYDRVLNICRPLFQQTPIDYFEYARFYDSGEIILLGTHPEGMLKAISSNLVPTRKELDLINADGLKVACLSHDMELPSGIDAVNAERFKENIHNAAEYNVLHRIYFLERHSNYYKGFGYGVSKKSLSIMNYYFNSMSLLNGFAKYFEWHFQDIIEIDAKKNFIILPNYNSELNAINPQVLLSGDASEFQNFGLNICSKRDARLTYRERECLSLAAQGYTMKNIARKLQISPRTVEQHLRNIKEKLGLNTKNQLVEVWHQLFKSSGQL